MKYTRNTPSINAGSTADIAFLLLIFFLVTTTIPNDKGIVRKLPATCPDGDCAITLQEKNVLRISLNSEGDLFLNDALVSLDELEEEARKFIDNNGANTCDYCKGLQAANYSLHPTKAVISLESHKNSRYKDYIAVQNRLSKVYADLREDYAFRYFQKPLKELSLAEEKQVMELYPMKISEVGL